MSQFNFVNEINNVFSMDGDISRGPVPRWQKKLDASSTSNLSASVTASRSVLSASHNTSFKVTSNALKTPGKLQTDFKGRKSPTPIKVAQTPGGGDRFIPNRSACNMEMAHFYIRQEQMQKSEQSNNNNENNKNANNKSEEAKADFRQLISETMNVGDPKTTRILSFQSKAPNAPDSHQNPLKVVYSMKTPSSSKSNTRYIPTAPDRILDAPEIINDYYLNLMDWNNDNIVTVALGNSVYLWNAGTGVINQLLEFDEGDHACSLAWIEEGNILAIGNNSGSVELWDCSKNRRLRIMEGHSARVGSLAWNSYILSTGSRDSSIIHHDVRVREHKIGTLNGHSQEVCGLKWSEDFKYLASGGNDNLVNIWQSAGTGAGNSTSTTTLFCFNQHQAAVRALAWCPWQPNILATGGGTADRCIKFWNVNNGTMLNSVDTHSQVCALLWSRHFKEIISAHGFANNQLTIWKYPSMMKQAELTGHTSRVLQMALSPDGNTVISAGADETLRLWNCFVRDPQLAKKANSASRAKRSVFRTNLR